MDRKRKLEVMPEPEPSNGQQKPTMNPYNGKLYSQRYHDILEKRQGAQRTSVEAVSCIGKLRYTHALNSLPPPC